LGLARYKTAVFARPHHYATLSISANAAMQPLIAQRFDLPVINVVLAVGALTKERTYLGMIRRHDINIFQGFEAIRKLFCSTDVGHRLPYEKRPRARPALRSLLAQCKNVLNEVNAAQR
jgi:hypothetical protein